MKEPKHGTPGTVWVQWKGTDACMDLWCECGCDDMGHWDGYGAYAIQCGFCGRKYNLPQTLALVPFTDQFDPVIATGDHY